LSTRVSPDAIEEAAAAAAAVAREAWRDRLDAEPGVDAGRRLAAVVVDGPAWETEDEGTESGWMVAMLAERESMPAPDGAGLGSRVRTVQGRREGERAMIYAWK
jgi:hypothetical protein